MSEAKRLYLLALEIDPLEVDKTFRRLPSHLTLVSRFLSDKSPSEITGLINPVLADTLALSLTFGSNDYLGPEPTHVTLVVPDEPLIQLHTKLVETLTEAKVTYANPQFIGAGWKPHVSKRANKNFLRDERLTSKAAYLIEVTFDQTGKSLRTVRHKFNLV